MEKSSLFVTASKTSFKRIMIFGLPGSGKTTFSYELMKLLHLPLDHLDRHFFVENWIEREKEHFLHIQKTLVEKETWIIDGNALGSLEMRFRRADIALYFRFNRLLCLWRLVKRCIQNTPCRLDRAEGCSERLSWKLIRYMWGFHTRVQRSLPDLRRRYPHVLFLEVCSDREVTQILQALKENRKSIEE